MAPKALGRLASLLVLTFLSSSYLSAQPVGALAQAQNAQLKARQTSRADLLYSSGQQIYNAHRHYKNKVLQLSMISQLKKAVELREKYAPNDWESLITVLDALAQAYNAVGNNEEALRVQQRSWFLTEHHYFGEPPIEVAVALLNLGEAASNAGQFQLAKQALHRSAIMLLPHRNEGEQFHNFFRARQSLVHAYYATDDFSACLAFCKRCAEFEDGGKSMSRSDQEYLADAYYAYGNTEMELSKRDGDAHDTNAKAALASALPLYQLMLARHQADKDGSHYVDGDLAAISVCMFAAGDVESALETSQRSLSIREREGVTSNVADSHRMGLATLYVALGTPVEAEVLFLREVSIARKSKYEYEKQDALCDLGSYYWQTGQFDKAIVVFQSMAEYKGAASDLASLRAGKAFTKRKPATTPRLLRYRVPRCVDWNSIWSCPYGLREKVTLYALPEY